MSFLVDPALWDIPSQKPVVAETMAPEELDKIYDELLAALDDYVDATLEAKKPNLARSMKFPKLKVVLKSANKHQSLDDLLYIQSNNYISGGDVEYHAHTVDEMIAIKSDAYALAMSDDYIEAMEELAEYEATLLQSDDECPNYADSDLVPFIVSPVIVPTCFLGSLRSTFSYLLVKFYLLLSSHLTRTVLKRGNEASIKEKVPIMTTERSLLNIRKTSTPDLGYARLSYHMWTFVHLETGATIGPHYDTKAELLADLKRYCSEFTGN